jgi:Major tropism determinant N-terminal domain/Domain of unknown function (DUF4082)
VSTLIKLRRGPEANLPLLQDGEPAFTTDSHKLFVGQAGTNYPITGAGTPLTQMSITSDAAGLKLVNDAAAPGASRYFGTNAAAVKGWHALPVSTREGIWSFSTTTTMTDPGSGKLRFNAATPASVTALALSKLTDSGIDATNTLKTLTTGDAVQVQDQSNAANWIRLKLTGPVVNNTSWFQLPVTLYEPSTYGGVVPNNNSPVLVAVTAGGGGAGGAGTVTSVGLSAPAGFPVTGSPVTGSGSLAFSSPLTTKGDLFVHSGSTHVRLGVGTNGQVLTADSAQANGLHWAAAAGGGTTILNGAGAPSNALGAVGNYYEDTNADIFYGPKEAAGIEQRITVAGDPGSNKAGFELGLRVRFTRAGTISRLRYKRLGTSNATLEFRVWNDDAGGVKLTQVLDTKSGQVGAFEVTLPAPVAVVPGSVRTFSVGATSGIPYLDATNQPVTNAPDCIFIDYRSESGNDVYPSTTTDREAYFVEPIFTPDSLWPVAVRQIPGLSADALACSVVGRAPNSLGLRADISLADGQVLARAPAATTVAGRYLPGEILGQRFNATDESTTSTTAVALASGDQINLTLSAATNLVFLFWVDTYNTAVTSAIHGVTIWRVTPGPATQLTSMSWPVTAQNTIFPMIGKLVVTGEPTGAKVYELRFQTNAGTARYLRRMMMIQRGL